MTGLLTGLLPALDDQALNAFWEKRKREAGKVAEKTRLHPRVGKKSGKSQFNWRPTLDLKNLRKSGYFVWGLLIIGGLAVAALLVPQKAYSPGDLSSSHTSDKPPSRGFALEANGASCSSCHYAATSINQNCISCHTTDSFRPAIYDKHQTERMGCVDCHAEHRGANVHTALIAYGICSSCHNDTYTIKYGVRAGSILGVPHGGTVGYPVVDHKWVWKGLSAAQWKARGLQEALAGYSVKEQFHLVHQVGRMQSRMRCTDCHTAGVPAQNATDDSPRAECARCHGLSVTGGSTVVLQANCSTCHQQHGQSMDTAALMTASAADSNNIKKYVASLNAPQPPELEPGRRPARPPGGAQAMRQGEESLSTDSFSNVGAVPWYGWLAAAAIIPLIGLVALVADSFRVRHGLGSATAVAEGTTGPASLSLRTAPLEGPSYPHPVINAELCIGCHACVEACPHDVLAIVDGIASPVALDQCMEDTSCQVECPTNPKACIVVNTKKKIPPRKVPVRNQRFMTNVDGIYLIGDVSGVPLIKNAVNEGAQVLDCILEELNRERKSNGADYDVAIIGMGPAGLSAAVLAKQKGLRVLALEQDTVASTIQNYPAGKYVFFKPDTVVAKGGIPIPGAGEIKEDILRAWEQKIKAAELDIHEQESCVDIKRGENLFIVLTEKGKARQAASYSAETVVLAIGNRGAPMKLGVPGEDLKLSLPPDPRALTHCMSCGGLRKQGQRFCTRCGIEFDELSLSRRLDDKVKYKLQDPDDYSGKKCMIVGAGNSAIEAAVDLCGLKRDENGISFIRNNEVTLVVRSDFKGDLKLGNKMNVYDCMDAGKIKVYFRTGIKEISESAVVLQDIGSKDEKARVSNDYVFALIGAEKPIRFLQSLGIKIAG
jgi:thioredoxin reductase